MELGVGAMVAVPPVVISKPPIVTPAQAGVGKVGTKCKFISEAFE